MDKSKYNILIMLNDSYIKFGIIFLNSLYKNTNIKNLNKIIINDIGLCDSNKHMLHKYFNKIVYYESNKNIQVNKVHSDKWLQALTMKTKGLRKIIEKDENIPVILMDTDMIILRDFDKFIDNTYDIQICKRRKITNRWDLPIKKLKYIASFLIINTNNQKLMNFIDNWVSEIKDMYDKKLVPTYETPSLCKMIYKYQNEFKIGLLDEDKISTVNEYIQNKTHILHYKSVGNNKDEDNGFINRLKNIKNYDLNLALSYLNLNSKITN